jgi:Xaa-Pro aminopeptidase
MDTRSSPYRLRVERVRDALQRHSLTAVVVPSSDPHLSEYLPERWQGRQWISGFRGSMGTLVVTLDAAALFADSRYWVQAEAQLVGSGIELVRIPTGSSTAHLDWLVARSLQAAMSASTAPVSGSPRPKPCAPGSTLPASPSTPNSTCWPKSGPERPALPKAPVYEHRGPEAPLARAAKLSQLRSAMALAGATHHFISTLDDIAWVLNLRGADVDYNPVFLRTCW